ncbi:hypothetical protein QBC36DRAFT_288940 [Triangularia setosa]|uniref:Uncharacterized protein n=1 Tax=Triangularia setosa TaxID=2587417 RepID=A0AAN6W9W1_9PEZI|nr:hypothetical protein QBC36DRAFT_288940 [Podospora setosa]
MKFPAFIPILTGTSIASTQVIINSDGSVQVWNAAENDAPPAYSFLEDQQHTQLAVANNNAAPASCCSKGNRCYRALEGARGKYDAEICKRYTKTVFKEPAAMRPFQKQCWNKPQKLSPACSCFAPTRATPPHDGKGCGGGRRGHDSKSAAKYPDDDYAYPPKPTCGPPGSPCTVDNFAEVCCTNVNGSVGCSFPAGDPQYGTCFL